MKYRRILNEVEAIQFTGSLKEVKDFLDDDKAIKRDTWMCDRPIVFLQTAYGVKSINEGDYVVREGDRVL